MAVPIKFTADFTDVRLAFNQLVSQAARGVPLGFGGGGGGGFSSTNFGFSAGQATISATIGAGGSTGGGQSFSSSFVGRGFGRGVGLGYLAHLGFAAAEANRQYNIDSVLAGGNQRGELDATMKYRSSIISAGGWIGQAVGFLQDPSGNQVAGIQATVGEADAQDAQRASRAATSEARITQRGRLDVASTTDPYDKRLRQSEDAHQKELRQIEERQRAQERADAEVIEKRTARLKADRGGELTSADYDDISSLRNQQAEARRGFVADAAREDAIHGYDVAEINRSQRFTRNISDASRAGSVRQYALEAQGNSIAARREGLVNQNNLDLLESAARRDEWSVGKNIYDTGQAKLAALDAADARAVRLGLIGARTDLDVTNAQIEGDPLQAKLKAIQGRTKLELESPLAIFSKDYAQLVRSGGQQAENLAIKEDAESRNLRDTALRNRGAELNVLLRDDRYAGIASESLAIKDAAFLRVQQLGINNAGGRNNGAINQILNNAQTEQQLLVKQLVQFFSPQSVSPSRTDLSGGGHGGDVQKTLNDIAKNTADTAKGLANVGKAL